MTTEEARASEMRPNRCGCGGALERGWHPDGTPEAGVHCVECHYGWDPADGLSVAEGYQRWQTYLADLWDDLRAERSVPQEADDDDPEVRREP